MAAETGFAEVGVATTYEAAGRTGLLAGAFLRVVPGSRAAGLARTALCAAADNLAVHRALERIEPGAGVGAPGLRGGAGEARPR